ncbi:MAG: class I SAM-dependent RNA methyltransferase [Eubacteriales bacterium]|nr:class I SAM-dependent RNA methyltransferase [Eubacteriales bacterium]
MRFITTCLFGLEKLAGEDIDRLGYERISTTDGRIEFEAPSEAVAYCNINFRYSERVLIKLGSFAATTFDALFEGTKALPWENYISRSDAFPVKGHSIKSKLFSVPDCQSIIKKAVCARLGGKYGLQRLPETGVKKQIVFFIMNDEACLMIDTTGEALHKRGYRTEANIAPIRETLAAAMVALSRPRENVITVDPMCGSGTIPIEAALLASDTAPGINRGFSAEAFGLVDKKAFADAREEARSRIKPPAMGIYGLDIDNNCIETSHANSLRAGTQDWIDFKAGDITQFTSPVPEARGTIVCNPPYGERMLDREAVARLEKAMGAALTKAVPAWQLYFISSDEMFERNYGRYADKKRTLYNGMIKCLFYQYFKTVKH